MDNHQQRKHALLSASGSERWMNCPPSARLEESMPTKESSVYADEGTLAHELADNQLSLDLGVITKKQYNKKTNEIRSNLLYYEGMEEDVELYIDYCKNQLLEAQQRTKGTATFSIEDKIDLTEFIPDGFGSNDFVVLGDGTLDVIDLKFGKGVRVSAVNNSQLMLYGIGSLRNVEMFYDITQVRLTIVQPRLDHISTFIISAEGLRSWAANTVAPLAQMAHEGKGELKVGDHCKWCRVKPVCKAYAEYVNAFAAQEFEIVKTLSDNEIIEMYERINLVQDYLSSLNGFVMDEALAGKIWPGYKLVEGRANRKWVDEQKAIDILKENDYPEDSIVNTKIKGIGDIEKLVGKTNFPELLAGAWDKPSGKPTLVPESDKRPALGIEQAKIDFKN